MGRHTFGVELLDASVETFPESDHFVRMSGEESPVRAFPALPCPALMTDQLRQDPRLLPLDPEVWLDGSKDSFDLSIGPDELVRETPSCISWRLVR